MHDPDVQFRVSPLSQFMISPGSPHEALLVLDAGLNVRAANMAFYTMFKLAPEECVGRKVYEVGGRHWDEKLRPMLETVARGAPQSDHFELVHDEKQGGQAIGVPLDVTDRRAVDDAVADVVARLGGLDILVNNAGGLIARVAIAEMSDDHWQRVLDLNLASAFYCTRAVAPHLGPGGRIVNVSSQAAENGGGPGASAYAAAKAASVPGPPKLAWV